MATNRKQISAYLDERVERLVVLKAAKERRSLSSLVEIALIQYLEREIPAPQPREIVGLSRSELAPF